MSNRQPPGARLRRIGDITEEMVLDWMVEHDYPPPRRFPREMYAHIVCEIMGVRQSMPTAVERVMAHVARLNKRAGHPARLGRPEETA